MGYEAKRVWTILIPIMRKATQQCAANIILCHCLHAYRLLLVFSLFTQVVSIYSLQIFNKIGFFSSINGHKWLSLCFSTSSTLSAGEYWVEMSLVCFYVNTYGYNLNCLNPYYKVLLADTQCFSLCLK